MDAAPPADSGSDSNGFDAAPLRDAGVDASPEEAGSPDGGPIDAGPMLGRGCELADTCLLGVVPAKDISDFAYDDKRSVLYLVIRPTAKLPGAVHRWDLAAGAFDDPVLSGGAYRGVDLSPDQDRLIVSDALYNTAYLWLQLVDLRTDASERVDVPNTGGEDGAYMATFADDDTVLVSSSYPGSGFPAVRRVDVRSGAVDELNLMAEWAAFARSADGSTVGVVEPSSRGQVLRYDVQSGATRTGLAGDYRFPYDLCLSPDGGQMTVLSSTTGAIVLDRDLALLGAIGTQVGDPYGGRPIGCAYNPVSGDLYLAWSAPPEEHAPLEVYDPATLERIGTIDTGSGYAQRMNAFSLGRMRVSRDGTLLFVQGYAGVAVYALGAGPAARPALISPDAVPPDPPPAPEFMPRSVADAATAYQINAAHTGAQTGAGVVPPLTQKWAVDLHATLAYPLIAEGLVFACAGPQLYAFDRIDGSVAWGPKIVGQGTGTLSIAYENGRVYAVSSDGLLAAFDAPTGTRAWTVAIQERAPPPIAAQAAVYLGGRRLAAAFDQGTGAVLWSEQIREGSSSPASDGSSLFFGESCADVYAFDAELGSQRWYAAGSCDGIGGAMPAVFRDRVYVRDADALGVFDAASGDDLGSLEAKQLPAFDGSGRTLLVATAEAGNSDELRAFVAGGAAPSWTFRARNLSAPITAGGYVYVVSKPNVLYVLDAATGQVVDGKTLPAAYSEPSPLTPNVPTSLAIGEGTLVVPAGSLLVAY